ncbi:chemosensory receptor b [Plakobranchus ocellatus]|uniref:Chemosensory receptor b n=1 Tax=Plakobranchus ocellatus TaxID=259542 RepID=A0AAV4A0I7_9GAST|nr:chemosensory receptor b [Plakobranchus ocellatus]
MSEEEKEKSQKLNFPLLYTVRKRIVTAHLGAVQGDTMATVGRTKPCPSGQLRFSGRGHFDRELSNISLTALAICDFTLAVLFTWSNLCFWLTYHNVQLPFHGVNVTSLTGGAQSVFLSTTGAWITAFISFERCLCILFSLKLRKISSWRLSVTSVKNQRVQPEENPAVSSSAAEATISQKEERLVRMVVAITTIFIVSYIPTCIMLLCYAVIHEFNMFGVYRRLSILSGYRISLGQLISGIYYKMASKFRSVFRRVVRLDRQDQERQELE